MSKKEKKTEALIKVRAINVDTDEVIFEGHDGEDVIRKAEESGQDYILDFETNSEYNFIF